MEIKPEDIKFEEALKRIEEIVKKLENGESSLEEALKLYEEGIYLIKLCEKMLNKARERVEIILKEGEGFKLEPLDESN